MRANVITRFTFHVKIKYLWEESFDTPTDLSSSYELSFFPSYVLFTFLKPTHCTAAPTQLFQSGGRPRRSVPAELKWDLESWGAALPDWEASPASSSRAGDTVGSTFCTGHLPCRYIGIAFHSFISKHKISKLNWMQFKIFIHCLNI